jgi:predicted  nucleic acid-binding Zn-ribbon protein/energy-coupling factor transporter ATP-binding protein EcfA2
MEASTTLRTVLESPFPGLRAFGTEESILFFGRETHTAELLRRLSESRFLAITGPSGCGKSSLVYAGLLPALYRGYLVNATSRWRFATFRPGNSPIDALAAALAKEGALGPLDLESLRAMLCATSGGLVEAVRWAGLAPGESLLVVADQFEELFRFATKGQEGASERSLFVSLLLHAVESGAPIYVALTMRSEYQGACSQFPGLPEALNRSQYLVSRMTREQYRQAIVRPLELVEVGITPRLVNQMLNDTGNDPDQLPVLQHALLRTYRYWKAAGGQGDIDLVHYEAKEVGGIETALALHGDGILARFPNEPLAEKIFRCLTGPEGRRPKELHKIYDIVKATSEPAKARVKALIAAFAHPDDSLLMLSSPALEPDTVVDITHESLIRKWPTLKEWVKEEAKSAEWYSDLARDVVRKRTDDAGLWQDPELSRVLERYNREGWNKDWALQYSPSGDPPFDEVKKFLDDSTTSQTKRRRRERLAGRLLLALLATVALAISVIYLLDQRHQRAEKELSDKYLAVDQKSRNAQLEADRLKKDLDTLQRQYADAAPAQKAELLKQIQDLGRDYTAWQSRAGSLESELNKLRQTQALAASDQSAFVKRIQELQEQLATVTDERDKLKSELATYTKTDSREASDLKVELEEWQRRTGEAESRLAELRRIDVPPTPALLEQYGIQRLSLAPSARSIVIGVGAMNDKDGNDVYLRLYVWRSAPWPTDFGRDARDRVLAPLANRDCSADESATPLCFKVWKDDVRSATYAPPTLTLGDIRYEIRVTEWREDPDQILLVAYAVPPRATKR